MFFGVAIGLLLRNKNLKALPKLINIVIYLLLFSLGIIVGTNEMIIKNLHTIGLQALIITLGGIIGSITFSWLVYRYFFKASKPIFTPNPNK